MVGAEPAVSVGLTTLPSRIAKLEPTLESLLSQTLPPETIFVSLPARSIREGRPYELPSWLERPPAGVRVVRTERDYGPGTKLLGCLPLVEPDSCLIAVDDDMAYKPFLVERLYCAQVRRREASFSFFVERIGRLSVGQAADGFSHWAANLSGVTEFAEVALKSPHLFVADDLWISVFLQNAGVAIESLEQELPGGEPVWEATHAEGQLSHLSGDLRRPNTFRQGRRFLLGTGLLRRGLRIKWRLGVIEHAASRNLRRLR